MRTDVKITYREYRDLPETGPQFQLLEGELAMGPAPSLRHQVILGRLFNALYNHVRGEQRGVVLSSPLDLILSEENVLQPDLVYISPARRGILTPDGLRGAPDLCVEILSPRSRDLDLGLKRLLYARHGVAEYWGVSPEDSSLLVYRLEEQPAVPATQLTSGDRLTTRLLPGFALDLAGLFAE
jgi:Uma2 family endonuclease